MGSFGKHAMGIFPLLKSGGFPGGSPAICLFESLPPALTLEGFQFVFHRENSDL